LIKFLIETNQLLTWHFTSTDTFGEIYAYFNLNYVGSNKYLGNFRYLL